MWENRLSRKCENFCPWEFFFSCKVKILCVYTNYFVLVDDCAEWFLRADSAKHPFGGKSSAAAGETPSVPSAPPGCTASAPRGALSITWSWLPAASKLFPGQVPHAPRPSRGPGRLSSNTPGSPDGCVWEFPQQTWLRTGSRFLCFPGFRSAAACLGLHSLCSKGDNQAHEWFPHKAATGTARATMSPSIALWNNCYFLYKPIFFQNTLKVVLFIVWQINFKKNWW